MTHVEAPAFSCLGSALPLRQCGVKWSRLSSELLQEIWGWLPSSKPSGSTCGFQVKERTTETLTVFPIREGGRVTIFNYFIFVLCINKPNNKNCLKINLAKMQHNFKTTSWSEEN